VNHRAVPRPSLLVMEDDHESPRSRTRSSFVQITFHVYGTCMACMVAQMDLYTNDELDFYISRLEGPIE